MIGAARYITFFIIILFVFNTFVQKHHNTRLDGTWKAQGASAIKSIKLNVTGTSYLMLEETLAQHLGMSKFINLAFARSTPGGYLSTLTYKENGDIKSDIYFKIVPFNKHEFVIVEVSSFKLCNKKCIEFKNLEGTEFKEETNWWLELKDLFF